MSAAQRPLVEVTRRAIGLLTRELGPSDTARFLAQFSAGAGDYTAERPNLFAGRTVAELAADIRHATGLLNDNTEPAPTS